MTFRDATLIYQAKMHWTGFEPDPDKSTFRNDSFAILRDMNGRRLGVVVEAHNRFTVDLPKRR